MKNFKYLFFFSCYFIVFPSSCSSTNENSVKKKLLVTEFLNYYFNEVLQISNPVVLGTFLENENSSCMLELFDKSSDLGFKKKDCFREPIKSLAVNFHPVFFSEGQLPNNQRLDAWKSFSKKYPKGFFVFSPPIINENLNRIIFCYGNYCGDRCGNGVVVIYEKNKNGKWKLIKKSCEWIS